MPDLNLDDPRIPEAILEYEEALAAEGAVKKRLESAERELAVLFNLSDRDIWQGQLKGFIKCFNQMRELAAFKEVSQNYWAR